MSILELELRARTSLSIENLVRNFLTLKTAVDFTKTIFSAPLRLCVKKEFALLPNLGLTIVVSAASNNT
jgi:hypothetical protein